MHLCCCSVAFAAVAVMFFELSIALAFRTNGWLVLRGPLSFALLRMCNIGLNGGSIFSMCLFSVS